MQMVTVAIYQPGDAYSGLVGHLDVRLGSDCDQTRYKSGEAQFAKALLDFSDN